MGEPYAQRFWARPVVEARQPDECEADVTDRLVLAAMRAGKKTTLHISHYAGTTYARVLKSQERLRAKGLIP